MNLGLHWSRRTMRRHLPSNFARVENADANNMEKRDQAGSQPTTRRMLPHYLLTGFRNTPDCCALRSRADVAPFQLLPVRLANGTSIAWLVFAIGLCQFLFFTAWTLNQPIVDMWGFRPAQTAVSVYYMLHQGAWFANIVPVFGEPWFLTQEFPLFQWCVALLTALTGAPIDVCGRIVSALFAIAVLWPVSILAKTIDPPRARRLTLLVGAFWFLAPAVVFWGRTFLIETTTVFLSAAWLAFYVRFVAKGSYKDFAVCLVFGILAAVVKITAFAGFCVVGFLYTCAHMWVRRAQIRKNLLWLSLAATTVLAAAIALILWGRYTDGLMAQNPLAALLRVSNIPQWYFGHWSDRWGSLLWEFAIRGRDIPEILGGAWFVPLLGLAFLGLKNRATPWVAALIIGFVSGYLIFPELRINNAYYIVENAILLCAAAAIVIDGLLQRDYHIPALAILGTIVVSQLLALHNGPDGSALKYDLQKHPYYLTGVELRSATPPDSVIVVFGTGWGADVPYFADRRGIAVANWFPPATLRQVLFDQRDRWFGHRQLGAVVDCAVFSNQATSPNLAPILDALKNEMSAKATDILGSAYGADVSPPHCKVYLGSAEDLSKAKPSVR